MEGEVKGVAKMDERNYYFNLGQIYFTKGQYQLASKCYKLALKYNSNDFAALNNLGNVYKKLGKNNLAITCYLDSLKIITNRAEPYSNLATIYFEDEKYDLSEKYLKKAINLNPNYIHAVTNLKVLYKKRGDYFKKIGEDNVAIEYYKKLLELDPSSIEAYYGLGLIYEKNQNLKKSQECFRRAININPNCHEAFVALYASLTLTCDFDVLENMEERFNNIPDKEKPPLLDLIKVMDEAKNLKIAKAWSDQFPKVERSKPYIHKKIRLGYLSCDFYDHATSHLINGIFQRQNRSKFEIFTYSYGPDDKSWYRKKIKKDSDKFIDILKLSDEKSAELIKKDEIDILIDLKGYTRDSRMGILALRPAPIQVSWLGFPGTTGASFIDYIITDKIVTPNLKYYTEKLIFMPCYQINDDEQKISNVKYKRSDFGLPEEGIILASFNATFKINKETFDSWLRILKRVPDSTLWIYAPNIETKENLFKYYSISGSEPARLVFADNLPKDKHLARITLTDICLDTFTYNGHTTTSDCLWAGVPVVTLKGNHFASRVSASLLTSVGLPELITNTKKEYEDLAVKIANDKKLNAKLKQKLQKNVKTQPLFDTKKFVDNLEKEYLKIIKK